jgi:hypothetical protein
MTYVIKTVNGLCGSGKTTALIKSLHNNTEKTIIAVPTIVLAEEYKSRIEKENIKNCMVIHSENSINKNPANAIKKALADNSCKTLIITQASFQKIELTSLKDVNVIYDEIPTVDSFYEPYLPFNHNLLTDWLEIDTTFDDPILYKMQLRPVYKTLSLKNTVRSPLEIAAARKEAQRKAMKFIRRPYDSVDALIKPIIEHAYNGDIVLMNKENYKKIVIDRDVTEHDDEANKLYFTCLRSPRGLTRVKSATVMGANLDTSMMYDVWSRYFDIKFETDTDITPHLDYADKEYRNGHLLELTWLHEKPWTKTDADRISYGMTRHELNIALADKEFGDMPVLGVVNNSHKEHFPIEWVRCPVIAHGVNIYSDYKAIYFGAALNRTPRHNKMLTDFGIDKEWITRATAHEVMHQCVMRTALRDSNNTDVVKVVVADKPMADELARLFPGCSVNPSTDATRKSASSRTEKSRSKGKIVTLIDMATTHGMLPNGNPQPTDILTFVKIIHGFSKNNIIDNFNKNDFKFNDITLTTINSKKSSDVLKTKVVVFDIDNGTLPHEVCHNRFSVEHAISHLIVNGSDTSTYKAYFFINELTDYDMAVTHIRNLLGVDSPISTDAPCVKIGFEKTTFTYKFKIATIFELKGNALTL